MGPYKPKKVRPSNLSANFVVSPVDSSEEEVSDHNEFWSAFHLACISIHAWFTKTGSDKRSRGKALVKTSSFEQEEEEEAQAAAMLAVRQISLLLHRFVPFRFVSFRCVAFTRRGFAWPDTGRGSARLLRDILGASSSQAEERDILACASRELEERGRTLEAVRHQSLLHW